MLGKAILEILLSRQIVRAINYGYPSHIAEDSLGSDVVLIGRLGHAFFKRNSAPYKQES